MLKQTGIDKKISPHKLRHTYATNLLNAGAELVDIKHESIATTQIYTNVGQERMEKVTINRPLFVNDRLARFLLHWR